MKFEHYSAYIEKIRPDGWLRARFSNNEIASLPEYLQVYIEKSDERETFTISEGIHKGKKGSVKRKGRVNGDSDRDGSFFEGIKSGDNLTRGKPHNGPAKLIFYRDSDLLEFKGQKIKAKTVWYNKIPLGTYDIEIPDAPHEGGGSYINRAKYARTWFRLGNKGDRYLHCGRFSEGCVTVEDIDKWDDLYKYLILSRKNSTSVGTIDVIDK